MTTELQRLAAIANPKRGAGRFFSAHGGLSLAIRGASSLAGSVTLGIAAGIDAHGGNINKWQEPMFYSIAPRIPPGLAGGNGQ